MAYAQDHRGHGASVASPDERGVIGADGWTSLVADIGALTAVARAEHPGLPVVLLAHSLGSFAAQQYLIDHSADVTAVVMTGTSSIELLAPALDLDQTVGLEMFNAPFQPARTDFDWLTRDEAMRAVHATHDTVLHRAIRPPERLTTRLAQRDASREASEDSRAAAHLLEDWLARRHRAQDAR